MVLIGEWTGAPLQQVLEAAGGVTRSRALRRHRHLRRMVRGIRPVRSGPSANDPGLRTQWSRSSEGQRLAAPSPRRTTVRIQERQVSEIDPRRGLDGGHWQGHGWNQLQLDAGRRYSVPGVSRQSDAISGRVDPKEWTTRRSQLLDGARSTTRRSGRRQTAWHADTKKRHPGLLAINLASVPTNQA